MLMQPRVRMAASRCQFVHSVEISRRMFKSATSKSCCRMSHMQRGMSHVMMLCWYPTQCDRRLTRRPIDVFSVNCEGCEYVRA